MREILFRGKRLDNGEWVCGNMVCEIVDNSKVNFITNDEIKQTIYIQRQEGEWGTSWNDFGRLAWRCIAEKFVVDPETVGQYTGLCDKNGKKIFEGDICQIKNHRLIDDTPFIIKWEDFVYSGWVWKDLDEDGREDSFTPSVARQCEVIGNIHDNPGAAERRITWTVKNATDT